MSMNKVSSKAIGLFFILPLIFYGIGGSLVEELSTANALSADPFSVRFGGFLMILNSITVIAIGILVFPILSVYQKNIALTYLVTRICEAILLLIGIVTILSLNLTETNLNAVAFQSFQTFAFGINHFSYQISMLMLGLGSIPFCYTLYKAQRIPKFLALSGCFGYGLLFIGSICELFGISIGIVLSIPGGLFELGFGVWLIVKGFQGSD